uniref:Uncharacterized protein n=1 Tax=Vitis vinifera TaxID=29760 RepID=A5BQ41_VITVI|nr:hypothetical protein VITISV_024135 [Vitis vinifera]
MAVGQDSWCETSGEGGTSAGTGFSNVRHPGGNGGGEGFRVRGTRMEMAAQKGSGYTRMEMAALKDSGCEAPRWKWRRRRVPGVRHPDGNVVMGGMKGRYGLPGYGGLSEWFLMGR